MLTFLASGPMWKALLMATVGLFLILELSDGVGLVPVAMGLFGVSEIMLNLEQPLDRMIFSAKIKNLLPNLADWALSFWPIVRGSSSACHERWCARR